MEKEKISLTAHLLSIVTYIGVNSFVIFNHYFYETIYNVKFVIYLTECWKYEPNERPNMRKVVSTLKKVISHISESENNSKLQVQISVKPNSTDPSFEESTIVSINNIIID